MRKFLTIFTILLFSGVFVFAQTRTITGKVTDAAGQPVEGASIQIKGSNVGTSANQEGNYSIPARRGDVIVVSAVNFAAKEFTIAAQNMVNVTLDRAEGRIEEIVVTAVGIRRSDKELGYAVAKVDPSVLLQKSEPDVLKGLQGKVAGVDIRSSQGAPGAATRIQIRGNSSFFGDNQPLIIVDGIPYSNTQVTTSDQTSGGSGYSSGISDLDPNDIATMSVLKGSSAAALYGSRASNGVILITTKSGSASRAEKALRLLIRLLLLLSKSQTFLRFKIYTEQVPSLIILILMALGDQVLLQEILSRYGQIIRLPIQSCFLQRMWLTGLTRIT